jgi:hypothetical protein
MLSRTKVFFNPVLFYAIFILFLDLSVLCTMTHVTERHARESRDVSKTSMPNILKNILKITTTAGGNTKIFSTKAYIYRHVSRNATMRDVTSVTA